MNQQWTRLLQKILIEGEKVSPRGKLTRELPQQTLITDLECPVLTMPERKLNYQFMAAEAYWILSGDNTVAGIAPWNKHIAAFSDDGETFFGAYGPKVVDQLPYVVRTLAADQDSRQAGLTLWRENPPKTKDVPCTVAMFFSLRRQVLNVHAFMRSSDAWLGVPYDVFNFSMLGHLVCIQLNEVVGLSLRGAVKPGKLYLTAASSHLYEPNWKDAERCAGVRLNLQSDPAPDFWTWNQVQLLELLKGLRDSKPGDPARWWRTR